MDLIVFDIDGTLLHTTAVDDACYAAAVTDVFGIANINTDWSVYVHCTDVAIVTQLVRERLGREMTDEELGTFRRRFVELLREAHRRDAGLFLQTPGAHDLLSHLASNGAAACLATGGFEASAKLKIDCASLDCLHLPAAFAEDGLSRQQIITASISRAQSHYNNGSYRRTISIGDGLWDLYAAASLDMPFIGIATGRRADRLRQAGATIVLPDFSDLPLVMKSIETAPVPTLDGHSPAPSGQCEPQ